MTFHCIQQAILCHYLFAIWQSVVPVDSRCVSIHPQVTVYRRIWSPLWSKSSLDILHLLFSLCHFTDCRPTAGSSVDVEGQVNKSMASYAKLIKQRLNCAAQAHPHIDRHRQGICTHTLYIPAAQTHTCTCTHLVINLMVTLETHRFVTDVCAWFIYVYWAQTWYSHSVHSQQLGGCLI